MRDENVSGQSSTVLRNFLAFVVFAVFAFGFSRYFQVAVVHGKSMEPTLSDGRVVVLTRAYWLFGEPRENDIVVLDHDGSLIVKRLIERRQGQDGPYVWVQGDNLEASEDSRRFGYVPMTEIVGKLIVSPSRPESQPIVPPGAGQQARAPSLLP